MKKLTYTLLFTGTMLLSQPTSAAGPEGLHAACQGDIQHFCGTVQPGGGRIMHCLQDHYKEVSNDCYEALEKRHNRAQNHDGYPAPPPPALPKPQNGDGSAPPPSVPQGGTANPSPDSGEQP